MATSNGCRQPAPSTAASSTGHRTAGGRDYWLGELRSGTFRITITASFYASPESRLDRVDRTYRSVLLRTPDPGGRTSWADQLRRIDDVDLAEYLAASDEFFQRAQR